MSKTFLFQVIQFSQTVLIQTIQFGISTQFSFIWLIDRALSGATIPGQSEPGSNGNEGVLHVPLKRQHHWNLSIRLFSVINRTLVGGGGVTLLFKCSWFILQPHPTGQLGFWVVSLYLCPIDNLLYNCRRIFLLSFFVLYILTFGLVRLRTVRLSAWFS